MVEIVDAKIEKRDNKNLYVKVTTNENLELFKDSSYAYIPFLIYSIGDIEKDHDNDIFNIFPFMAKCITLNSNKNSNDNYESLWEIPIRDYTKTSRRKYSYDIECKKIKKITIMVYGATMSWGWLKSNSFVLNLNK